MPPAKRERAGLRVKLFGGFETRLASGGAVTLPTRKAQALLAYLAVRPGQGHPRDKLAALLWGDRGDVQARDSLRHALVQVRKAFPRPFPSLTTEGRAVALDPAVVDVDVVRFEALVGTARTDELIQIAEIYQGEFLEGFVLHEPGFEDWLVAERARLRELALGALRRLLDHQTTTGMAEPAIQTALRLLTLDATHEVAHRALMGLYAQQGRRAAALRQYQACVGALRRELDTEPEPRTRQLYQEIVRRRDEPADTSAVSASAALAAATARRPVALAMEESPTETPLVGRGSELTVLGNAFEDTRRGRGRALAILGEAGVGKSRLVAELARTAAVQGARVLIGRCHESEQILPFGPWAEALRAGYVVPEDPALLALDASWRAELARLFPEIAVVGLPAASDDARRLFESVTRLVRSLARNETVVLVLEDVHWADDMTSRLLAYLGRRIAADRVLVIATAREEELADAEATRRALAELSAESHFTELALAPLSRPDTVILVRLIAAAGTEAQTQALTEQAWAASEGNPFVVMEAVRAHSDGATDSGGGGLTLSERVRQMVGRRLDRLSENGQRLAAAASVIGREFEFALMQRAAGLDEVEAAERTEELVRRRVLHGIGERFDFTHDRIREVAYVRLVGPRRRLLHAAVGGAIETLYGANLEPHCAALAAHYHAGEVWDRAVRYLRRAGALAAARSAYDEAVRCFEQALAAVTRLPESRDTIEQTIDVRCDLRNALHPLGQQTRVFEHLREAEALAERLDDRARLGRIACYLCIGLSNMEEHDRAIAAGRRALALATGGSFDVQVVAQTYLGWAYHRIGDFAQASDISRRAVELLTGELEHTRFGQVAPPAMSARVCVAYSLAELGDFAEGKNVAADAVRLAEATGQPYSLALALSSVGLVSRRQGALATAIPVLERAVALCQTASILHLLPQAASVLAVAYVLAGRTTHALPLLDQTLEHVVTKSRMLNHTVVSTELSEGLLLMGRLDDAAPLVERLLETSQTHPARGHRAHALYLQGELAARRKRSDAEQAAAHFREALALAETGGMRPLVAHCHGSLGALYRRLGKHEESERHLRGAAAVYRELEMPLWLPAVTAPGS